MRQIVLISCVKQKLPHRAPARDLYISQLFKLSFAYAQRLRPDAIYILSAKHGLLPLDVQIDPYDETLLKMPVAQRKAWASKVLEALGQRIDLREDHVVFLAGKKYREHLVKHLASYEIPLEGLTLIRQQQRLRELLHAAPLP